MRWIEKYFQPFLIIWTSSTTVQSFGKIVQRMPAVGAKIWVCMFFVCHAHGALFFRGWHNLKRYCVTIYESILMQFTSFFRTGLPF